jgi:hypothetical protein
MNRIFLITMFLLLSFSQSLIASPALQRPDRVQLWGSDSWYLLGLNYPWFNYGHDFGETNWGHDGVSSAASRGQIDADFADMKSKGIHVVRWFVFADGRASPEFDESGMVTALDGAFYADFDAALEIAEKHDIYLLPVLFDFHLANAKEDVNGVQLGGRSSLITNPQIRESFLDKALKPLLEEYGQNPRIIAWEVMNEPEGAMRLSGGNWVAESVEPADMQTFVNAIVNYIHARSSQQVTVGSAARSWLYLWVNSNLDFYQFHYYDHLESDNPLDYPAANLGLDKPVMVGEFPTQKTDRSMKEYLEIIAENGYAGALAWSYRAGDEFSDFTTGVVPFTAWSTAHHDEVAIGSAPAQTSDTTVALRYDFETGNMGWVAQDYIKSQACNEVEQSAEKSRDGDYSLKCFMNLVGGDEKLSQGETFVEMFKNPPIGLSAEDFPLDLRDCTITILVYVPTGAIGDPSSPNGLQVFVKDSDFRSEYGTWRDIKPDKQDQWIEVQLPVSATEPIGGYMDKGFDPSQIIIVGVKMGAGGKSEAKYDRPIYIDSVTWDCQ